MRRVLLFVFVSVVRGQSGIYDDDMNVDDCCEPFWTKCHASSGQQHRICTRMLQRECCEVVNEFLMCRPLDHYVYRCCPYRDKCGQVCSCKDTDSPCHTENFEKT